MKKKFKILSIVLCLLMLMSSIFVVGCDFIKIDFGEVTPEQTPDGGNGNQGLAGGVTNYSLGLTYDVEENGVTFVTEPTGEVEKTTEQLKDAIYESVVIVESEIGVGAGVIVDLSVEYKNTAVQSKHDNYFIYILTCHHVIDESPTIKVYIPKEVDDEKDEFDYTSRVFSASLVGSDVKSDIAVLRVDLENNVYGLTKANVVKSKICSDYVNIGDKAVAIGNPTGELPGTFTSGEISGLFRKVNVEEVGEMELLQISAAINPGNSGGGLFNVYGQLIGLVNAGNIDYQNIGFAIPATGDTGLLKIATELVQNSSDEDYGYIAGRIKFGSVTESTLYNGEICVQVAETPKDGLFYKYSIPVGAILLKVEYEGNEYNITTVDGLISKITEWELEVGKTIKYTYRKNIKSQTTTLEMTMKQYVYASRATQNT